MHPGTSSHANGSYTSYMTEHGEISPADALYNFSPGEAPATYEDMVKWGEKDEHGNIYPPAYIPASANKAPRVKAGFITLVRNSELEELQKSMLEVEHRFNRKYNYPWIFLNDADFDDNFKKGVRKMTRAEIRFGKVGKEHWGYPDFIDQKKAADTRERMKVSALSSFLPSAMLISRLCILRTSSMDGQSLIATCAASSLAFSSSIPRLSTSTTIGASSRESSCTATSTMILFSSCK